MIKKIMAVVCQYAEKVNPQTAGNAWVGSQHRGYWCPGAKAPGHQYPKSWLNLDFIGSVWYKILHTWYTKFENKITVRTKWPNSLTHWGRVTHICVSKLTTIGSDNNLNQYWNIVNSNLRNKLQFNFKGCLYIFIQENAFENVVWKMLTILSRPQCVKSWMLWKSIYQAGLVDITGADRSGNGERPQTTENQWFVYKEMNLNSLSNYLKHITVPNTDYLIHWDSMLSVWGCL